ncbi:response regulator [Desulfovibrio sp. JC022]|uniref:response regulator n=1 Tax=Desulfovibrio sp. JC022 TaxID=2593642 RepID=UPI0013D6EC7F|nr:response regulator [Desulfovibrio sp. JC022]NDV21302.1 response regulator [Desulfovibrio sp. JC022]
MDDVIFPDMKLLVAEDSAPVRLVLKTYLGKLGITPKFAEDGREAMEMLTSNNFDIIIMDVHMPELGGREVVTKAREKGIKTPIIAMTTGDDPELLSSCIESGYNGFLLKPILKEDVINTIKKYQPTA